MHTVFHQLFDKPKSKQFSAYIEHTNRINIRLPLFSVPCFKNGFPVTIQSSQWNHRWCIKHKHLPHIHQEKTHFLTFFPRNKNNCPLPVHSRTPECMLSGTGTVHMPSKQILPGKITSGTLRYTNYWDVFVSHISIAILVLFLHSLALLFLYSTGIMHMSKWG